jgi:cephalosporin hydroxylase
VKVIYDEALSTVTRIDDRGEVTFPLASAEGFETLSRAWLRASWDVKYPYAFSWFGRPIIQLPEDMIRIQEVIWSLRPDVIIETGVAHGGSLIFYASLLKAMGLEQARVVGVELELRPHNEEAILAHPLSGAISIVKGSSIDADTVGKVTAFVKPGDTVLVILDSNHTRLHVLAELRAYAPLVSVGSYAVATDGIMGLVAGGPRTKAEWVHDNPEQAAKDFVSETDAFVIEEPKWPFNEGLARERITYWPGAFVKRVK